MSSSASASAIAVIPVGDANPTRRTAFATGTLIAANVLVFVLSNLQLTGAEQLCFVYRWAAVPHELLTLDTLAVDRISGPACLADAILAKSVLLSPVTAMFLHAGIVHLAFNMLFLWVFGNNVEDRLGHVRFVVFYVLGGLASTYAFALFHPRSISPLLGASGAIAAVLGAYLLMYPKAHVHTYVPFPLYLVAPLVPRARIRGWFLVFAIVSLPAWLVLLVWLGTQVTAVNETMRTGVAYEAHIAGFLAGILLTLLFGGLRDSRARRPRDRWA